MERSPGRWAISPGAEHHEMKMFKRAQDRSRSGMQSQSTQHSPSHVDSGPRWKKEEVAWSMIAPSSFVLVSAFPTKRSKPRPRENLDFSPPLGLDWAWVNLNRRALPAPKSRNRGRRRTIMSS